MDLHIERPELNAKSAEENIALVDTWIADTSDKLNIAIQSMQSSSKTTSTSSSSANSKNLVGLVPYLGEQIAEAKPVIFI